LCDRSLLPSLLLIYSKDHVSSLPGSISPSYTGCEFFSSPLSWDQTVIGIVFQDKEKEGETTNKKMRQTMGKIGLKYLSHLLSHVWCVSYLLLILFCCFVVSMIDEEGGNNNEESFHDLIHTICHVFNK